ncbi:STAS domain-containing protein [Longispora sp. K20-0274]|uniref:STAS domain-containing protein n=1 Tax=Longispora sp. K20-0274 TaxID=3088255 RepID=UPI00399BAC99
MTPMTVTEYRDEPAAIRLRVAGEVDIAGHDLLLHAVLAAVRAEGVGRVRVDLSAVTFLDSTGVGVLIAGRNAAHEHNVGYEVIGATGMVRDVLDLAGVTHALLPEEEATAEKDSDTFGFGV